MVSNQWSDEVEECEHKHPHEIYKVPVQAYLLHHFIVTTAVVYATVFRASPEPLEYRPRALAADDARFLRRVAWESVQFWEKDK